MCFWLRRSKFCTGSLLERKSFSAIISLSPPFAAISTIAELNSLLGSAITVGDEESRSRGDLPRPLSLSGCQSVRIEVSTYGSAKAGTGR